MKITAYYIKKSKSYTCTTMTKIKSGKLEYFVRGEGWKKTKAFVEQEIEIPDSKDILEDIKAVYDAYGRDVTMRYMITNNAEGWKQTMLLMGNSLGDKISGEDQKKLQNAFDLHISKFIDFKMTYYGIVMCDVVDLETHLRIKFGYGSGSMSDFVKLQFGQEIHDIFMKTFFPNEVVA